LSPDSDAAPPSAGGARSHAAERERLNGAPHVTHTVAGPRIEYRDIHRREWRLIHEHGAAAFRRTIHDYGRNLASTDLAALTVTVHTVFKRPETESHPIQVLNAEPRSGWAVRVTIVP
jgi:hypothetical protein